MAKLKTRRATVVVTLMVVVFLGALFHHLLNFDYKVERIGEDVAYQLGAVEAELKIEEDSKRNIVLRFTLRNATQSRMKLADCGSLSPMYEVKMQARDEEGKFEICPPSAQSLAMKRKQSTGTSALDRDSLTMIELLPASGYTRTIVLSDLFEFQRNGNFSVSINYRPDELAAASKEIGELNFYKQHMKLSTSFELPLKKPVLDTPPPKGDPKPAAKTPAAPNKVEPAPNNAEPAPTKTETQSTKTDTPPTSPPASPVKIDAAPVEPPKE